jgi:3-methyl-2-oxobutanoate hydroxymethyltransferase
MRVSTTQIQAYKKRGERFPMITCYDYSTARIADEAGIPIILVGDSLGMVMLGYDSTVPVTMDDIVHHTKAVVRGTQKALIVGDLPFMSYHVSVEETMRNAGRLMQEAGAGAVKLEGAAELDNVRRMLAAGIPVMGHLGLTPQSVNAFGGWKAQGKTPDAARRILDDALALEDAGCFAIVLETVPATLARIITARLRIPTIGIGAGPHCDGQVQVLHDMLGWFPDRIPKHAKQFAHLREDIQAAFTAYMAEVRDGSFPGPDQTIDVDAAVFAGLEEGLKRDA